MSQRSILFAKEARGAAIATLLGGPHLDRHSALDWDFILSCEEKAASRLPFGQTPSHAAAKSGRRGVIVKTTAAKNDPLASKISESTGQAHRA